VASLDLDLALPFAGNESPFVSPEQAEQFKRQLDRQAEKLRQAFKGNDFKPDHKQMDELKRQLNEFEKNVSADNLKFDSKEMEQFEQLMRQFHSPDVQLKMREQMQREMDRLKRQFEEMQAQGFDHMV
jgi:hypothetical protein